MSFAKGTTPRKSPESKPRNGDEKTTDVTKEAVKRSSSRVLHVSVTDDTQIVSIPRDQEDAFDVWAVYSHAVYATKKEQRFLKRSLQSRIHENIAQCSNLFPLIGNDQEGKQSTPTGNSGRRMDGSFVSTLQAQGYGKNIAACAMCVLSVWPSLPINNRPPMSTKVQRSFEDLQAGTHLYVFNEKPNSPLLCDTALRLLHSIDGDEVSVTIFNATERSVIDGYIPLSFVVSLSFGLEPVERVRHLKKTGTITCSNGNQTTEETSKRAFTLHCSAPELFYVTFIAETQEDFDKWTCVIDYFALLNSCYRTYLQSR
ncbi:hypothetical protein LMJF_30_1740 [Leishmania major strain Friedlin]|uniref:PH domain-containing protein n=1 Tax=Leishmania major TaxID=5664 RepID=Q4Q7C0_LEIMA|nr:hypothetical protein LMJF_30_1740 [Leishmania major strain Friedlin]CAG9578407.1 hypothetical_protein_-_conserved [Leishmania major strain Friedlin]CAJ06315.1 hypothetical protein LMJF_30_1740 [Leishmania major strain Friedlin]|eukprot:XP_001684778.1 hypothetical protein LMJF_30_1740 [Leishmania major strain Friedlin]